MTYIQLIKEKGQCTIIFTAFTFKYARDQGLVYPCVPLTLVNGAWMCEVIWNESKHWLIVDIGRGGAYPTNHLKYNQYIKTTPLRIRVLVKRRLPASCHKNQFLKLLCVC